MFAAVCGGAGSLYALWMIYAAGLKYLALAFIVLVLGIPVFIWARRDTRMEQHNTEPCFTKAELFGAILIAVIAAAVLATALAGGIQL